MTERKYRKNPENYVVTCAVDEKLELATLLQALRTIKEGNTDLFVSIYTESDSEILELPSHIQEIVRSTDLKLTISFTFME